MRTIFAAWPSSRTTTSPTSSARSATSSPDASGPARSAFSSWLLDYTARHVYRRGYLTRVQTIHFARWVLLDEGKRLFFASNYDGSVESYMDDFINKVAWGINLVFSNGVGFPRTTWLLKGGARFEQKYKRFLRRHQLPTAVWYNAYPGSRSAT